MCGDSSASLPHNSMLLGATVDKAAQRILLDWNTYSNWPNGLRTFEVWRKLDNDAEFTYYQSTDTATRFMISDPMESFRHCYRVKALQDGGSNVSWSNDTCVVFEHLVNIPSAFSPNGDGKNDTWTIRNIQAYKDVSIEVFSRWGEKVFEASGYSNDWDGTMNGKALPDATYFYVIKLKLLVEGQKETYTGNVTIMR
jgi:gliding motility-associated-like protein